MYTVATIILLCCVAWAVVAGLLAIRYCAKRGIEVNPVLLGIEMLRCLSRYRKLTHDEIGHIGPLFYHYVVSINAALVVGVALLIVRFG